MSTTRGTKYLTDRGIRFEDVEYIFKEKGAGRAAKAVGWNEEQVIKSLVVEAGPKDYRFALVPAHRELSLKKLARLWGKKEVVMAPPKEAERLTGYVTGGISPFGSYANLPSILEETLLSFELVLINAGHRGILASMSPWDMQELLNAEIADIVT